MAKVIWINAAIEDLRQVFLYVARQSSPARAEKLCDEILATTDHLQRFPDSGALVSELDRY